MERVFTPHAILLSVRSVAEQPLGVLVLEIAAFLILMLVFVNDLKERHALLVTVLVCSIILSLPVGLYEARLKKLEKNALPHPVNWYEERIQHLEEKLAFIERKNEIISHLPTCYCPPVNVAPKAIAKKVKFPKSFNSTNYFDVTELE